MRLPKDTTQDRVEAVVSAEVEGRGGHLLGDYLRFRAEDASVLRSTCRRCTRSVGVAWLQDEILVFGDALNHPCDNCA